jgi:DNA repair photolyase
MMAPIIPGVNSHEILPLVKEVASRGALKVGYTMVRLNGQIAGIFSDWLNRHYPDRANKVLNQISDAHGGSLNDSRFGTRMRGQGNYAEMVRKTMNLAKKRYLRGVDWPEYNTSRFRRPGKGQLSLWQ